MLHPLRAHLQNFVPLTDEEWAPLAAALRPHHLARGDYFVTAGQHQPHIAFVLRGACRVYCVRPDGEERTTYFFFEQHLMADYTSCLTGQPSQLSIQALADTELVVFDYAVLQRLYREWPVYLLVGTGERMLDLLLRTPAERYADLLASGKHKIIERIPQHLIANYLGITAVSLSRIRARVARSQEGGQAKKAGPAPIS
jgi:CRP-like cAMP-binding protein